MVIELDCRRMTDRLTTHAYLKETLQLPDYYGNNLDALFDVLTEWEEQTELVLKNWRELTTSLGEYGASLLETLRQATEENPVLEVTLVEDNI